MKKNLVMVLWLLSCILISYAIAHSVEYPKLDSMKIDTITSGGNIGLGPPEPNKNLHVIRNVVIAHSAEPKKENLYAKYCAATMGLFVAFEEGAEQGFWYQDETSKWPGYTKDNSHLHFGLKRVAMVGTGLMIAQWKPKQKLLSWRTANQWFSYWTLYSWAMNRGLRLVQSGELYPPEYGHSFYLDFGFLRIEVQMRDWMQHSMLGIGVIGLVVDTCWNRIF